VIKENNGQESGNDQHVLACFSAVETDEKKRGDITQVENKRACKVEPDMIIEKQTCSDAVENAGQKREDPYPVGINYLPYAAAFFQVLAAIGGNLCYNVFKVAQQDGFINSKTVPAYIQVLWKEEM
jgi:hypothetical protein